MLICLLFVLAAYLWLVEEASQRKRSSDGTAVQDLGLVRTDWLYIPKPSKRGKKRAKNSVRRLRRHTKKRTHALLLHCCQIRLSGFWYAGSLPVLLQYF